MEHKKFEDAERIIGWREMQPGYWYYISMETRGTNKWNKPITVVTVKLERGGPPIKFYAPPSLYYGLKSMPTPRSFCMKACFRGHPATCTQNSSMPFDFTREKKTFSFFRHLKLTHAFYNG